MINDEEVVPLLLSKGATFEEALDYAVSGCAEARMPNRDTYTSGCAYINFAAALEMTLYSGKMRKYGDEQIGLQTGDPRSFKSWEEFYNAYLAHQTDYIKQAFIQQHHIIRLRAQHFAVPLGSALHDLCMQSCLDLHQPKIPGGIDMGYFEFIGYGTVVDSLSAIKKLVFEEKKLTMSELLDALHNNFEGKEDVRQLLMNVPCYGNNDPYADSIAKALDRAALEFTHKYSKELGVHLDLRLVPFTSHVPFGKVVSATPNGRKAWTPLSDGSSASQGSDKNGPTAVLLSNFTTKNKKGTEKTPASMRWPRDSRPPGPRQLERDGVQARGKSTPFIAHKSYGQGLLGPRRAPIKNRPHDVCHRGQPVNRHERKDGEQAYTEESLQDNGRDNTYSLREPAGEQRGNTGDCESKCHDRSDFCRTNVKLQGEPVRDKRSRQAYGKAVE